MDGNRVLFGLIFSDQNNRQETFDSFRANVFFLDSFLDNRNFLTDSN